MQISSFFRVIRLTLVALIVSAPVLSCERGSSGDNGVSVVDSAGVEIVESRGPLWSEGEAWRVSESPILQIGTVEGDPDYELHLVRGVVSLSDGRIVVANDGSGKLRYYDEKGAHLLDVGGKGDGPGEFQYLYRVWTLGADSVAAFDNSHNRVSIFDPEGKLVRTVPLPTVEGMGRPSAQTGFRDGSILSVSGGGSVLSPREGRIEGGTWIYSRYSAEGIFLNKIGEGRGGARWGKDFRGMFAFPYLPLVLGIPPAGAGRTSLYLGDGTGLEVERRFTDGALVRIIRWNAQRRPVTSEVVGEYNNYLANYAAGQTDDPAARGQAEAWVEQVPFPEYMPAYQSLRTDVLGNLWVEQYRPPWEDQPQWWVFDPEGRWLGEVAIPKDFRIEEIGNEYLLGVRRDENRVEFVVRFALRRGVS